MKKIIATLLLLVFTTNIASFAGEVIIIGSDGQARYENEDLNTPVVKEAVTNLAAEKPDLKGKADVEAENQEIKINIKNIYKSYDKNDKTLLKYHEKFVKYLNRDIDYFLKENITSNLKGYEKYNFPEKDSFDKNNPKILRFELQNGDYAIMDTTVESNKKYKYAAEYHKDGTLFGIVQIKTILKTRKSVTVQFVEYRDDGDKYKYKHIMFIDIEKNKNKVNIAQFVYNHNVYFEHLVCAQINNDLYLNKESKNLIVKMQKFDIPNEVMTTVTKENLVNIALGTPVILMNCVGVALAVSIGIPLLLSPFGWPWLFAMLSMQ